MSAEATVWAWGQYELTPAEKVTLLAIADQADMSGLYGGGWTKLEEMTGAAYTTVSRHVKKFEDADLCERREVDRTWYIRLALREQEPSRDASDASRSASSPPRAQQDSETKQRKEAPPRGRRRRLSLPDIPLGIEIPDEIQKDAEQFLWAKRKVGGKIVTPEEMLIAAAAMSEFNRQADSHQGLASALTSIIGRVRDRPSWDAEKHVRLVQSAFRIRWWDRRPARGSGRLTPAVIYGNERCFENVALDAADEKAGKQQKIEQRRGRFRRTRSVEED